MAVFIGFIIGYIIMSAILHPLRALYLVSRVAGVCCMFYGVGSLAYPETGFKFLIIGVVLFFIPKKLKQYSDGGNK